MTWPNLYKWAPGMEPEWVGDARTEEIERVKAAQAVARDVMLAKIRVIARDVVTGDIVTEGELAEVRRRAEVCGIDLGARAMRNRLTALGYDCGGITSQDTGWPRRWNADIRHDVGRWLAGEPLLKSADEFCFIAMADISKACSLWIFKNLGNETAVDIISARSMRQVLEAEGFHPIKSRAGQTALIGYKLRK